MTTVLFDDMPVTTCCVGIRVIALGLANCNFDV
eukprot:CAMPEP_0201936636 /NCGR_PEP_ID=MMETSP0903-20130614/37838_1 /ASSEMBLY_ACC=CAM_ASM_000552 /TAXON_ID=420261 /ORGANISM="Thalassiosira antarctica, Strain CCMP982" /LENGTH=32 /DNA_ID= /DNA_START= /DNA_END= /DNA_ORIENTATION=